MSVIDQLSEVTGGVVYIHSTPTALCPHIEWALSATLGSPANLKWTQQPAAPGMQRATVDWVGPIGSGLSFARALRQWPMIRFEITEEASEGLDGQRFCQVPGLGFWSGSISANGDTIMSEMRLKTLIREHADGQGLAAAIEGALGSAWDEALEPYRAGGEGAEVTWLHRHVG